MERAPITCEADLDAAVGKRSAAAPTKSISHLDGHCRALLARSPFPALAVHGPDGPRSVTLAATPAPPAEPGDVARAARRLVSERVLSAGIAMDYRTNLY